MLSCLKIAIPGGRILKVRTSFPYKGSPIGYRVLINGRTGVVVGFAEEGKEESLVFPDKLPFTDLKNLEAVKDLALIYGLPTWQLMWELIPSHWNWTEESFLEVSLSSFQALDPKTKQILSWIADRKLVKEELAKKRFGSELINMLVKKGLLRVKKDWSAPDVEVELFKLNVPFEVALSKLRRTKRYAERVRLLAYLRERLYASREELREEGFSSEDLKVLISRGIVKVERELMQNFAINPRSELRMGGCFLVKKLEKPTVVVGSLSRLAESLFALIEEALGEGKSLAIFSFYNPTLNYLLRELKPFFGDRVISISSFESPRQFIKNWFLAQEEGRIVLSGRLGLMVPFKNLHAVVLFDDHYTKMNGYIDLRNFLFHLHKYYGCQFFYYTCALGVDVYQRIKSNQWEIQRLGYSAEVRILKRKPEEIVSQELLSELDDNSLLLVRKTGYSYVYCQRCGFLVECPRCKTFLTFSRADTNIYCTRCHWRGQAECTHCGGSVIHYGFGIERVMEEIERSGLLRESIHFDTKPSLSGVYKKVFLVHGDNILSVPSINAEEDFWKYIHRARAIAEKSLYIQSFLEREIIENYLREDFLEAELERRKEENLPPFSKLILAVFTKDRTKALESIPNLKTRIYGNILETFIKVSNKQLREILPKVISLKPVKLEVW